MPAGSRRYKKRKTRTYETERCGTQEKAKADPSLARDESRLIRASVIQMPA
jgi:hypothetical protein